MDYQTRIEELKKQISRKDLLPGQRLKALLEGRALVEQGQERVAVLQKQMREASAPAVEAELEGYGYGELFDQFQEFLAAHVPPGDGHGTISANKPTLSGTPNQPSNEVREPEPNIQPTAEIEERVEEIRGLINRKNFLLAASRLKNIRLRSDIEETTIAALETENQQRWQAEFLDQLDEVEQALARNEVQQARITVEKARLLLPEEERFRSRLEELAKQVEKAAHRLLFSEKLAAAEEAIAAERFIEAARMLEELRGLELTEGVYPVRLREITGKLAQAQEQTLSELSTRVNGALTAAFKANEAPDKEIALWIDRYEQISQDSKEQIEKWRTRFHQAQENYGVAEAVNNARFDITDLWKDGGVENAYAALDKAYQLKSDHGEHELILKLVEEAEARLAEIRAEAGIALTSAVTGMFEEALEQYRRLRDKHVPLLPRFRPVRDKDNRFNITEVVDPATGQKMEVIEIDREAGEVNAGEAIAELEGFAQDYARQKAEEKQNAAQRTLTQAHDPRRAEALLKEALALFLLPEDVETEIKRQLKATIEPAISRRKAAEKLRDEAEAGDVLGGWEKLQAAVLEDDTVPNIPEVRTRLRPRFQARVEQELETLQRQLEAIPRSDLQNPATQEIYRCAVIRAGELSSLSKQDEQLAALTEQLNKFAEEKRAELEEYDYVATQINKLEDFLLSNAFETATSNFEGVKNHLGERLDLYPMLVSIQGKLESRNDIDSMLRRIVGNLAAKDEVLEKYLDNLEEASSTHPNHSDVVPLLKRVRSRLNYRRGRTAFKNRLFDDARRYLEAIEASSDDWEKVQELLVKLEEAEHQQGKLLDDLSRAEKLQETARKRHSLKQWRQAYNILDRWSQKTLPSGLSERFYRAYNDLCEAWEDEALNELQQLISENPLDGAKIRVQLDVLETLNSQDLARWWQEALAPWYAQEAETQSGKERVGSWEQAVRLNPDNREYQARLLAAEKELVEQQIGGAPDDLSLAENLYRDLYARYTYDLDIRMRLVDIYRQQKRFTAAQRELEQVNIILQQQGIKADPHLRSQLTRLKGDLERDRDIDQRKTNILALLDPANEREDYEAAKTASNKLTTDYEEQVVRRALTNWWDEAVQNLAGLLEAETNRRLDEKEPLWKAAAPMLKILALQPNNGRASKLIGQMAQKVLALNRRVNDCLNDRVGSISVNAEEALDIQIGQTEELLAEVNAYLFALRHHTDRVVDGEKRKETLEEHGIELGKRLEELAGLASLIQEGYMRLSPARLSPVKLQGSEMATWEDVRQIEEKLQQSNFSQHYTVSLFLRNVDQSRKTREKLDNNVEALKRTLSEETFEEALSLIAQINLLDVNDEYGVRATLVVRTSLIHSGPVLFNKLEGMLTTHLEDLHTLYTWLRAVLQVAPWWVPALPDVKLKEGDLRGLNDLLSDWLTSPVPNADEAETAALWQQTASFVLPRLRQLKRKGQFKEAAVLCADVMGEDGSVDVKQQPFNGRYTLKYMYEYLTQPPELRNRTTHSNLMESGEQSARILRERIFNWLSWARQWQIDLVQDEERFINWRNELAACVDKLNGKLFPVGKNKIRLKGHQLYDQARQIAPDNSYLNTLYEQLNRG